MEELYQEILLSSVYDEKYAGNPKEIDGKTHGVCIDFSRNLIAKLREKGYSAGLISTLNADGFLHAAVLYKDKETNEVLVADPVTDVRELTEYKHQGIISELLQKRNIEKLMKKGNSHIKLRDYFEEMGPITDYDDSEYEQNGAGAPRPLRVNMVNQNEILANPYIVELEKKGEAISSLTSLENVVNYADASTLLGCQLLYEKGINSFCSNFLPDDNYTDIAIDYNSLSPENKEILLRLVKEKPDNYEIHNELYQFGYPKLDGRKPEINEDYSSSVCLGFKEGVLAGKSRPEINLLVADLIKPFQKQTYMEGVYSKNDVLDNKHNRMTWSALVNPTLKPCNSTIKNTNQEIADNEGLIYLAKYDMFFENEIAASRYIESLHRKENDWRTSEEIAKDAGIPFEYDMFFADEDSASKYIEAMQRKEDYWVGSEGISEHQEATNDEFVDNYVITPEDIATASKNENISMSSIDRAKKTIRDLLNNIKERFEGR